MSWLIKELDSQLHQTLDTVLAEAMARDIIHEVLRAPARTGKH
jgi:hypothetical protein